MPVFWELLDRQPIHYVVMQPTFCQKDPVLRGVVKYISFLIESDSLEAVYSVVNDTKHIINFINNNFANKRGIGIVGYCMSGRFVVCCGAYYAKEILGS